MAELLLASGAEVDARIEDGSTPLVIAGKLGRMPLAKLLLAHGAEPDLEDRAGLTAHDHATRRGHKAVAELLARWNPN